MITGSLSGDPGLRWRDATCANAAAPTCFGCPVIRQLRARPQERAARDALPGHPLAVPDIDDFLTDLANANKPRNTIRAYRGDLIAVRRPPSTSPR